MVTFVCLFIYDGSLIAIVLVDRRLVLFSLTSTSTFTFTSSPLFAMCFQAPCSAHLLIPEAAGAL